MLRNHEQVAPAFLRALHATMNLLSGPLGWRAVG
jgi:hypothetical protein